MLINVDYWQSEYFTNWRCAGIFISSQSSLGFTVNSPKKRRCPVMEENGLLLKLEDSDEVRRQVEGLCVILHMFILCWFMTQWACLDCILTGEKSWLQSLIQYWNTTQEKHVNVDIKKTKILPLHFILFIKHIMFVYYDLFILLFYSQILRFSLEYCT